MFFLESRTGWRLDQLMSENPLFKWGYQSSESNHSNLRVQDLLNKLISCDTVTFIPYIPIHAWHLVPHTPPPWKLEHQKTWCSILIQTLNFIDSRVQLSGIGMIRTGTVDTLRKSWPWHFLSKNQIMQLKCWKTVVRIRNCLQHMWCR